MRCPPSSPEGSCAGDPAPRLSPGAGLGKGLDGSGRRGP